MAKVKVIAVANHKGGVGKTTSVACIGAGLARHGKRTLLIDLDAQQNLTFTLMGDKETESSVYDSLTKGTPLPVVEIRENLDLVPSSLELARAETDLSSKLMREAQLKNRIEEVAGDYDYILLDCPPSLGIVTTNALVAATELYIPLTAEALPLKGLTMLDEVVEEIRQAINPRLELGGVFITRYNNRKLNKDVVDAISSRYGSKVFSTKIRENIALAEMPVTGMSIYEYDPNSNGATDYEALTEEILSREIKW